jgi:hypothetical protein
MIRIVLELPDTYYTVNYGYDTSGVMDGEGDHLHFESCFNNIEEATDFFNTLSDGVEEYVEMSNEWGYNLKTYKKLTHITHPPLIPNNLIGFIVDEIKKED